MDPATVAMISAGLNLGFKAYQAAKRLSAEGYDVPGLDEFEEGTQELRDLSDLTPAKAKGEEAE